MSVFRHWPKMQPDQLARRARADELFESASALDRKADDLGRRHKVLRKQNGFKKKIYGSPRT